MAAAAAVATKNSEKKKKNICEQTIGTENTIILGCMLRLVASREPRVNPTPDVEEQLQLLRHDTNRPLLFRTFRMPPKIRRFVSFDVV